MCAKSWEKMANAKIVHGKAKVSSQSGLDLCVTNLIHRQHTTSKTTCKPVGGMQFFPLATRGEYGECH